MSKLEVLLKRIHALPEPPPIFEPAAPSDKLKVLLNRIDTRRWLADEIPRVREFVKELRREIRTIEHIVQCQECLLLCQLDVERYLGTKCFWWLNMMNLDEPMEWEEEGPPCNECTETKCEAENMEQCAEKRGAQNPYFLLLQGMPRAREYKIGSYGHSSDDTIRFIKDRSEWAKRIATAQIERAKQYYLLLKKWNFTAETKAKAESLLEWLIQSSSLSYPPE
jgi:hypothetical protein